MRTLEDIRNTLTRYRRELEKETNAQRVVQNYVVIGGNMCVIKNRSTSRYTLSKGDPTPMTKSMAREHLKRQQAKVTDDIKLEMIPYYDWLQNNIKECERLEKCVENSLNGETIEKPMVVPEAHEFDRDTDGSSRCITMQCPTCPLGVNTCMTCKFFIGINTNVYPWCIDCGFKG